MMDDAQLLFAGSAFCRNHHSDTKGCKKCPLKGHVCISYDGNLNLGEKDGDSHINFVKFTEEFRYMVLTIQGSEVDKCQQ